MMGCLALRLWLLNSGDVGVQNGFTIGESSTVMHRKITFPLTIFLIAASAWLISADAEKAAVFGKRGRVEADIHRVSDIAYVDLGRALSAEAEADIKPLRNGVRVKLSGADFEVRDGDERVRVRGKLVRLSAPIRASGETLEVAEGDLLEFLKAATGKPVTMRQRRIFIGDVADFPAIQLVPGEPSSLVLIFREPVNPRIASDEKTVTLNFERDPAILSTNEMSFDDHTVQSLRFRESGSAASMTVSGSVPLIARFEDGNKRLVITAAPAVAQAPAAPQQTPEAAPAAQGDASASQQPIAPGTTQAPGAGPGQRTAVVAIDAAHGGTDAGVRFSEKLQEKEICLALAEKIRAELSNRGISSVMVRTADQDVSGDDRAEAANAARVAYYVGVHAGQGGSGIRVFTPMPSKAESAPFVPWNRVQDSYASRSTAFAAAVASQMAQKKIPSRQLYGNTAPINHVAAAAVAVELAPAEDDDEDSLQSVQYQQKVAQAIATAIAEDRNK
jgi:N-acetylmuramoyl-L-alanine amidase